MTERHTGRNGAIWRDYVRGMTQAAIAEKHSITQGRVSQIIADVRASVTEEDRREMALRELDGLDAIRRALWEVADAEPAPAYSNGRPIEMEDGTLAKDYGARMTALAQLRATSESLRKLVGLDAATKVEAHVTMDEERATREAAIAAAAYLEGGERDT